MQKIFRSFWLFVGLMFIPLSAYAADQAGQVTAVSAWLSIIGAGLYGVAHTVAALPPTVSEKLPPWFRTFLNLVAANYRNSKNRHG